MDYLGSREDYGAEALAESSLLSDPMEQFSMWLKEATEAGLFEPSAFVLGTRAESGSLQARTVLLRGLDTDGFLFYTNYDSRKGVAIGAGAAVSMVFGWYPLYRQVLVEGRASKVEAGVSDAYFATRPRDSQLGAWASDQSAEVASRAELDAKVAEIEARFEGVESIPRPPFWGGYRIVPTRIEFWKGRSNRLHDRIVFSRESASVPWQVSRLQP
jgi:pyridoxamine 5'-phosphate oxidase